MGSYPGAWLVYGVDLGEQEEWDADWLDRDKDGPVELAEQLLKGSGIGSVSVTAYGNFCSGFTLGALTVCETRIYAYKPFTVDPAFMAVPDGADEMLRRASELLGLDTKGEPGWLILLRYG